MLSWMRMSKNTLQLITYRMYFMTAKGKVGRTYAVNVNWVTQDLLKPINVAVSTKADSHTNGTTKIARNFVRIVKGSWVQLMPFQTGIPES